MDMGLFNAMVKSGGSEMTADQLGQATSADPLLIRTYFSTPIVAMIGSTADTQQAG